MRLVNNQFAKNMTQHEKILLLHADGGWICGNSYRQQFIFSPHKRRGEMKEKYGKIFKWRKCLHDSPGVRDYFMEDSSEEVAMPNYARSVITTSLNNFLDNRRLEKMKSIPAFKPKVQEKQARLI